MPHEAIKNRIERNYGVDLLRNISMLFVVVLHILGGGGMLAAAAGNTIKYEQLKLAHIAAMCAVNCYGIISGYVGIQSKFRPSNIITLWLQVFLYSAGIGLFGHLIRPDLISTRDLLQLCLPVLNKNYWYFTAYFPLFFAMPFLNGAIEHTPRKVFEITFGMILILLTFGQQTFFVDDVFATGSGYSFLWLAVLYCIGGYFRKYHTANSKKQRTVRWLLVYIGCVVFCWTAQFVLRYVGIENPTRLELYTSPFMLLMGIALVRLFANMKLAGPVIKATEFFAPAAFGVYLIHIHPLLWEFVFDSSFAGFATCPTWAIIPLLIGLAVALYLLCSGIDLIRHYLFQILKIKKHLSKLDKKILPDGGNT